MSRPREFDADKVLKKAAELFWQYGYEATSIDNLISTLSIQRGSLYGAFKNKKQLFLESLRWYRKNVVSQVVDQLMRKDVSRSDIEKVFKDFAKSVACNKTQYGCFALNTLSEKGPHCEESRNECEQCLKNIERAFCYALEKSKEKKQLNRDLDCKIASHYLVTFLMGLKAISKGECKNKSIEKTIALGLRCLD